MIATALAIIDEDGADALSMRALAQRLDSGTATLYRHFSSRAELVAQVVDAVLGETDLDHAKVLAMPWQRACAAAADSLFGVFGRHPNVAPLLVYRIPTGPNAMANRELIVATLLDAGFRRPMAAKAYATLARYVLGFAIQLGAPSAVEPELLQTWQALDPVAFPATAMVAKYFPVPLAQEFTFGLDLILEGLADRLGRA